MCPRFYSRKAGLYFFSRLSSMKPDNAGDLKRFWQGGEAAWDPMRGFIHFRGFGLLLPGE